MALTTRFGIEIPDVGADSDTWGTILNAYFNSLETKVFDKTAGDSVTGNVSITGNLSYTGTLTGGTGIINIGSGQIYKDASGNVGIGTSTPVSRAHLKQSNGTTGLTIESNVNDERLLAFYNTANAEHVISATFGTTGAFRPISFFTSDQRRLTLDTAGNLGLGVTPSAWNTAGKAVEVGFLGNALYSTGVNTLYNLSNAYLNQAGNFIYASTGSATRFQHQAGSFQFFTAPSGTAGNAITFTEASRITSGGDYYIGHTGTGTGLVTFYTNSDVINAHSGQAAGTTRSLFTGWHSATATTSGTLSYNVTTNGNVTNTNNSYGSLSDIKLKENVTPATPKLDDLMKVEFVNFNFIADETKRKQFGVIAQQLETVFPGLVESTPDTEEVEVTDDEGNVTKERKETGTVTKSVNYSVLALMACKALQEANTKIESLTQRITQLEAK